jgi:hypothetical protein
MLFPVSAYVYSIYVSDVVLIYFDDAFLEIHIHPYLEQSYLISKEFLYSHPNNY